MFGDLHISKVYPLAGTIPLSFYPLYTTATSKTRPWRYFWMRGNPVIMATGPKIWDLGSRKKCIPSLMQVNEEKTISSFRPSHDFYQDDVPRLLEHSVLRIANSPITCPFSISPFSIKMFPVVYVSGSGSRCQVRERHTSGPRTTSSIISPLRILAPFPIFPFRDLRLRLPLSRNPRMRHLEPSIWVKELCGDLHLVGIIEQVGVLH